MNSIDSQIYYWAHMLDEAFDKSRFLCEDQESKNISRAEKWVVANYSQIIGREINGQKFNSARDVITHIREDIPNVRLPYDKDANGNIKTTMHHGQAFKKATCKWIEGIVRIYFEIMQDIENAGTAKTRLDKILELMAENPTAYPDGKLSGKTYDDLNREFGPKIEELLRKDKEDLAKQDFSKSSNNDYEIVPIESFEEATKYAKYFNDDNRWCVTYQKEAYDSYTKSGTGRFYFCLKHRFEDVQKIKGEGCPMDEYGKSMIAISVNDDGSLNTCTCRWNHANGGDDNMMDTKQISEFFGLNFYKTFVPYPPEKILEKYTAKKTDEQDEFAQTLGFMECMDIEWINIGDDDEGEKNVIFYVKIENGKLIKAYKVTENIVIINGILHSLQNGKLVKGCPQKVGGDFDCSNTKITSLEGAPQKVGGDFYCSETKITSLEGAPQKVGGDFYCSETKITSLEGCPEEVGGDFYCSETKITSLEGAPKEVRGDFYCNDTNLSQAQIDAYEEFLMHPTPDHIDETGHYKE